MKKRGMENRRSGTHSPRAFFAARGIGAADVFAALCAGLVAASVVFLCGGNFTELTYVRRYPVWLFAIVFCLSFCAVLAAGLIRRSPALIGRILLISSLVMAVMLCVWEPDSIYFDLGIAFVLLLILRHAEKSSALDTARADISKKSAIIGTAGIFLIFFGAVFFFTAAKYKSFQHGAFDFGIFTQMFEQMAKTGLPYTTVERSTYLSHFAVHFSPVYYLLLPGYMIFRSPLYLLGAQAAVVGAGVFPVRRICRELGLSERASLAAAAMFALYPTMANGCFYDFHENKFLSVFLLWLVYFALKKNTAGIIIFSLLTLSVKEDAFIYVIAVCLWMLVTNRRRGLAAATAAVSVLYFFFACAMIRHSGGEIMSGRFENYAYTSGGGLLQAVRTCVTDIGYLIREVFAGADTEAFRELTYPGQKLEFVLWTAVPLLFAPFLRKRVSELVLLLPLLVINLMPRWMYQFDIDYQYTYGTAALMIFSALLFLGESSARRRRFVLCAMLCLCTVFSASAVVPKAQNQVVRYYSHRQKYNDTAAAIRKIPADASVTAYGYMVPHLYFIDDLHSCPEYYGEYEKTDYYVIDTRYEKDSHTPKMYAAMGDDYTLYDEAGYVKIYKLTEQGQ